MSKSVEAQLCRLPKTSQSAGIEQQDILRRYDGFEHRMTDRDRTFRQRLSVGFDSAGSRDPFRRWDRQAAKMQFVGFLPQHPDIESLCKAADDLHRICRSRYIL